MTIRVDVTNTDRTLRIEVIEVAFDKYARTAKDGPATMIEPGCSQSFYIHNLKDLRIREAHADLQARPAVAEAS